MRVPRGVIARGCTTPYPLAHICHGALVCAYEGLVLVSLQTDSAKMEMLKNVVANNLNFEEKQEYKKKRKNVTVLKPLLKDKL